MARDPIKIKAKQRRYYTKNRVNLLAKYKKYYSDNKEKILEYSKAKNKEYSQKDGYKEFKRDYDRKYRKTPNGAYSTLVKCNTKRYPIKFTLDEFLEWYSKQNKVCTYCGISESDLINDNLQFLNKNRRLTFDRMDNAIPYLLENMTLACFLCNNIKGKTFTYNEMKIIGKLISKKRT